MKRKYLFLASALLLFTLTSCSFLEEIREQIGGGEVINPEPNPGVNPDRPSPKPDDDLPAFSIQDPENPGLYTITYDCNNGVIAQAKVTNENKVVMPGKPEKLVSEFVGWYSDEELKHPFDFNTTIRKNTTIYAKYDIDYKELTNELSTDEIKGTVRILNEYPEPGKPGIIGRSLGSGTIIKEDSTFYYVITNNHVVYNPSNKNQDLTVLDAYLHEYDTVQIILTRPDYDLALLKVKKTKDTQKYPLPVIKLAADNLSKGEGIISVGNPLGQANTVTYGEVSDTAFKFVPNKATLEQSNVTFAVINHSAFIDSGSSGGALFDTNLHLIGVNFASSTEIGTNKFMYSHAIPLNRVREFLEIANFTI